MMKLPLEVSLPYRILALLVLAMFYGIYLVKQWRQKRRGIQTMQFGRGKDAQTHTVETLMGIAAVGIIPAQLLSIGFGWSHLPAGARFTGFCVGMLGDLIFLSSVLCMKDSWRAGIPDNDRTELVTDCIYGLCCHHAAFTDPAGGALSDRRVRCGISGLPAPGVPLSGPAQRRKMKMLRLCAAQNTSSDARPYDFPNDRNTT